MQYRRRKILIKPAYQFKLAVTLFIYIAIYSLILGFVIFYPLYNEMSLAGTLEEKTGLSSMVLYLHKRVWLGLFLVAVLAGVHAIFASHRLVGPMYRFEKTVESLINGEYGLRIKIRKKDEFREMEGLLNTLSERLEVLRQEDRKIHSEVRSALDEVRKALASGELSKEDLGIRLENIVSKLD